MDVDVLSLLQTFQKCPELCSVFDYSRLRQYFELVVLLKPKLATIQSSWKKGPPPTLPVNIHEFLKRCFSMSDYMGKLAWEHLRCFAWTFSFRDADDVHAAAIRHVRVFLRYGISLEISVYNLQPPTYVCIDARCANQLHSNKQSMQDRELVEPATHAITIFTKDLGAIPAFSTSRYCRSE